MIDRISETVQGWLGWCPQAGAGSCRHANPSAMATAAPADGGDIAAQQYCWLQRFRNWVLVQALVYTSFIPIFIPLFMTGDYLPFCSAGMGTAPLGLIPIARRLWRQ